MQARLPRCDEFEPARTALDSSNDSIFYAPVTRAAYVRDARDAGRAMSHLTLQSSVGGLCRRRRVGEGKGRVSEAN